MELEFKPPKGTDRLLFGTPRTEIRAIALRGTNFRTPPSDPENDMYEGEGLILGYDDKDELEFVEVVMPSTCHFSGISLIGRPLTDVIQDMRQRGYISHIEDDSHKFDELGIILFCPEGRIGSASIFKEGYYD